MEKVRAKPTFRKPNPMGRYYPLAASQLGVLVFFTNEGSMPRNRLVGRMLSSHKFQKKGRFA